MALGKYALEDGSLDYDAINKLRRGFSGGFGFLVPAAPPDRAPAPASQPEGQSQASGEAQEAKDENKSGPDNGTAPPGPSPPATASSSSVDVVDASSAAAATASAAVKVVNGLKVDETLVAVVAARCAAAMKKANLESASGQHTAQAIADKLADQAASIAAADVTSAGAEVTSISAEDATAPAETKSSDKFNDNNNDDDDNGDKDVDEGEDEAIGGIEGLDADTTAALHAAEASAARKEQRQKARAALKRQAALASAPFEPAPAGTWDGPRQGRYFGCGELGVGYYLDFYPVSIKFLFLVVSFGISHSHSRLLF
jgi:hypothetical protein